MAMSMLTLSSNIIAALSEGEGAIGVPNFVCWSIIITPPGIVVVCHVG